MFHHDHIHVIENGITVESGREEDLLARSGLYAKFFHMQFLQRGGPPTYGFYYDAPGGVVVEVSTMSGAS